MEMEIRLERGWEGPGKKDGIEVLMDDVRWMEKEKAQ